MGQNCGNLFYRFAFSGGNLCLYSTILKYSFLYKVYGSSLQIINLGAGFDTLYWRLKESGHRFHRFVEVDFSSVTSKKIHQIKRANNSVDLNTFFSEKGLNKRNSNLLSLFI